jgi:hypothetical protein
MTPVNVNLQHLIEQIDVDLAGSDALAKVSEAQQRARTLSDIGDQLIDHFVNQARAGGTSWSQLGEALGVSKQAAQQRWNPGIFARYTDRARHSIVMAQERARGLWHNYIDTEHVLLGVLAVEQGAGAEVVAALVGGREKAETAVTEALTPGTEQPPSKIPFTSLGKTVLAEATAQAVLLGHNYIGTEHLLLGLITVPQGKAAQLLAGLGVNYDNAHAGVVKWLSGHVASLPHAERRNAEAAQAQQGETDPGDAQS